MTLSPETLASLREAAEKATPGPWFADDSFGFGEPHVMGNYDGDADDEGRTIVTADEVCKGSDAKNEWANLTFIALANPTTILALLDERASLASLANALLSRPQPDEGVREAMLDASNTLLSRHGGGEGGEGRPESPSADAGPNPRSPHEVDDMFATWLERRLDTDAPDAELLTTVADRLRALGRLEAAREAGKVMVPVMPTAAMIDAGMVAPRSAETTAATNSFDRQRGLTRDIYGAMLLAAANDGTGRAPSPTGQLRDEKQ